MELAPDLLDSWGLPIREVGSVQLGVEWARLHWPSGEVRVSVLLQAAWSGECEVALELVAAEARSTRTVRVPHAEVRRVRLSLELPGGIQPLSLRVKAPLRAGVERVRAAWLKESTSPVENRASFMATLFGALKQAVGKRERRPEQVGPESAELTVELQALAGEPPVSAQEEVVWQPGMSTPGVQALRIDEPAPEAAQASRADGVGERPECPNCFTRAYAEQVRAERRCPSCGNAWTL